jgi:hypothetical protein
VVPRLSTRGAVATLPLSSIPTFALLPLLIIRSATGSSPERRQLTWQFVHVSQLCGAVMFFECGLNEFFVAFPVSPNESQHMTFQQPMDIFFYVHTYPALVVIFPFYSLLITGAVGKTCISLLSLPLCILFHACTSIRQYSIHGKIICCCCCCCCYIINTITIAIKTDPFCFYCERTLTVRVSTRDLVYASVEILWFYSVSPDKK